MPGRNWLQPIRAGFPPPPRRCTDWRAVPFRTFLRAGACACLHPSARATACCSIFPSALRSGNPHSAALVARHQGSTGHEGQGFDLVFRQPLGPADGRPIFFRRAVDAQSSGSSHGHIPRLRTDLDIENAVSGEAVEPVIDLPFPSVPYGHPFMRGAGPNASLTIYGQRVNVGGITGKPGVLFICCQEPPGISLQSP